MSYYPNTIYALREKLEEGFVGIEAKSGLECLPAHVLWMMDEIEKMNSSPKAGRWIGYATRGCEELGLLTNEEARDLTRVDVENGDE